MSLKYSKCRWRWTVNCRRKSAAEKKNRSVRRLLVGQQHANHGNRCVHCLPSHSLCCGTCGGCDVMRAYIAETKLCHRRLSQSLLIHFSPSTLSTSPSHHHFSQFHVAYSDRPGLPSSRGATVPFHSGFVLVHAPTNRNARLRLRSAAESYS